MIENQIVGDVASGLLQHDLSTFAIWGQGKHRARIKIPLWIAHAAGSYEYPAVLMHRDTRRVQTWFLKTVASASMGDNRSTRPP